MGHFDIFNFFLLLQNLDDPTPEACMEVVLNYLTTIGVRHSLNEKGKWRAITADTSWKYDRFTFLDLFLVACFAGLLAYFF